ncbi:hypothetical protein [Telluribacter sp.]|jgi:hypothetical protein|uniref:hypothetical protein n=1 Tax=Telluribacter sp. TaxID=1978767 RepID=UPI002E0E431B|nr:hypothetical protein [Telluribacter sp.]
MERNVAFLGTLVDHAEYVRNIRKAEQKVVIPSLVQDELTLRGKNIERVIIARNWQSAYRSSDVILERLLSCRNPVAQDETWHKIETYIQWKQTASKEANEWKQEAKKIKDELTNI